MIINVIKEPSDKFDDWKKVKTIVGDLLKGNVGSFGPGQIVLHFDENKTYRGCEANVRLTKYDDKYFLHLGPDVGLDKEV